MKEKKNATKEKMQSRIDTFLDRERNLAERDRLMEKAFVRGYFDDAKEVARKGDKLWEASKVMIPAPVAHMIFPLECRNLKGEAGQLAELCMRTKISLIAFAFNAFGEPHCKSFTEAFAKEFSQNEHTQIIQMQVEETWTKVPILKMMVPFIKRRIPPEQHVCELSPNLNKDNYWLSYENIEDRRRPVGISNKLLGWVVLTDEAGRIRWIAHGNATPAEIEALMSNAKKLLAM